MKKIVLFLFLLSTLSYANAIEPIRWGAVAGVNVSNNSTDAANNKIGFHVGGKAELAITNHFYLESLLLFTQKGYKADSFVNSEGNPIKFKYTNYYIELPIHAGYKVRTNDDLSIFVSGGGYLGVGLFGKLKNEISGQSISTDLYKNNRGDKRFDCGLGLKAGVEIVKKIQISAGYDLGLININKYISDYKNRNLSISCAYLF